MTAGRKAAELTEQGGVRPNEAGLVGLDGSTEGNAPVGNAVKALCEDALVAWTVTVEGNSAPFRGYC